MDYLSRYCLQRNYSLIKKLSTYDITSMYVLNIKNNKKQAYQDYNSDYITIGFLLYMSDGSGILIRYDNQNYSAYSYMAYCVLSKKEVRSLLNGEDLKYYYSYVVKHRHDLVSLKGTVESSSVVNESYGFSDLFSKYSGMINSAFKSNVAAYFKVNFYNDETKELRHKVLNAITSEKLLYHAYWNSIAGEIINKCFKLKIEFGGENDFESWVNAFMNYDKNLNVVDLTRP